MVISSCAHSLLSGPLLDNLNLKFCQSCQESSQDLSSYDLGSNYFGRRNGLVLLQTVTFLPNLVYRSRLASDALARLGRVIGMGVCEGLLWIFYGFLWISMDFYGFLLIFTNY